MGRRSTHTRHAGELITPGPGRKARYQRKLRTLDALRRAAVDLALEHGVDAISVADIAAAAGVSRRTFFNYFPSKEDALVGENPELSAFLREAIAARPADEPPLAAVRAALGETIAAFVTDEIRERLRARHQLLADHPELLPRHLARYAAFEQLLTDCLTARAMRPGTDAQLLATVIAGVVRLCSRRWARHGNPPLAQRIDTALGALHQGLH